ncbi:MAG: hypothetical protein KAG95_02670 [Bacteroidales bacterium]|nr:hypothetical protein [Bacteroidales bacterium]
MKGSTNTILYIIVIIASLLFSFLKKKKEKEGKKTVSPNLNNQSSSNLFSEILGEDLYENNIAESEEVKKPENIKTTKIKTDIKKDNTFKDIHTDIHRKEETSSDFSLLEDFDLPQAIVYSEILKRKEF